MHLAADYVRPFKGFHGFPIEVLHPHLRTRRRERRPDGDLLRVADNPGTNNQRRRASLSVPVWIELC
jgi:hypothetical protein